ncbi:MAG: BrnT family toxin [Gammaproteobacteria bacterium]|nr:BrnT family toxin [Gammaproteobacteria bacterium]
MEKTFNWNSDKNQQLMSERGICFEDIVLNINLGNELDIYDHPNKEQYPNQQVSVVRIEDYVYLVPFVESENENENEIFLKIIIPSRKATKQYIGESDE